MPSEACREELETLGAIFLNEIDVSGETPEGDSTISMVLYPATADDEESRYVTLTLELLLPMEYPKCPPKILFRNPRGLNDIMLEDLMTTMKERCEDRLESQMIYELIDMCKEFLTKNNRPASECPICLFSFTEFDVFYRTRCFHHFHSQCLGSYLKNLSLSFKEEDNVLKEKQELTCPVCRELLEDDIDIEKLAESPPPAEELVLSQGEQGCSVLQEWEGKKQVLKELFEKQKSQGGIIDLTETKKMLVISSPVSRDNESQGATATGTDGGTTSSANPLNSTTTSNNDSNSNKQGSEESTGRHQRNKTHPPNSHGNVATGSHRVPHPHHQLSTDKNSASGGGCSKPSAKSVRENDPELEEAKERESPVPASRHHQNGRNRRGGGYNNRDRRRNK